MMSLPSIAALHDRRERERERIRKSKTLTCDCCNKEFDVKAEGRYVEEVWSPLIADKPSGIVTICPECAAHNLDNHGNEFGEEGEESDYFLCADCQKLNVYNYSWEIYATLLDGEGYICQECAGKRYLAPESDKWLASEAAVKAATASIEALQAYGPQHLTCIGGHKKLPCGALSFRDTPEYEAGGLDWFNRMEMGGWDGDHSNDIRECALEALKRYGKVAITIAEAGQFQMYMDIVVDPTSRRAAEPEKKARKSHKAVRAA
jgi:hypothetical protein